ncbi:MAG: hypothetical protein ABR973_06180 [Candidatus Acidiferrales bacterium]|jgi:hypothetical protein
MSTRKEDREHEIAKATAMAHDCGKLEECFGAMGKAAGSDGEDGKMYHKIAGHFGSMKKTHEASIGYHSAASKAEGDELDKRLVPDAVRGTIPSNVPKEGFGITAVPRTGAPELVNKANVPEQWKHLVAVEDEEGSAI